jgi:hypothetical protein
MFTRGSRYEAVDESEYRGIRYKRIRFLPEPGGTAGYVVQQGDRPDIAAWRIAQDPEAYWRLADANGTMRPAELTARVGTRIRIPRPGGAG